MLVPEQREELGFMKELKVQQEIVWVKAPKERYVERTFSALS